MADGSQAASSLAEEDEARAAQAEGLLRWLGGDEGAPVAGVRVGPTAYGGLGVLAARAVPAGGEAFRCPCSAVLTADLALEDPVLGPALRAADIDIDIDRHHRLMLLLLHHRRLAGASPFAAYVRSLPGDELAASLPLNWPPGELRRLLGGSQLSEQAEGARRSLERFHERVVAGRLSAEWPEAFPPQHFGLCELRWAHAVYWSRAIVLPLPSGARPCLVPLLDMCNHSPRVAAAVSCEAAAAAAAATPAGKPEEAPDPAAIPACAAAPSSSHDFVLRCSRAVAPGEEIHINYGAKGNAELLRCHGFVLPDNPADVFELDLAASWVAEALQPDEDDGKGGGGGAGAVEARLEALRRSPNAKATRHFLFRGALPPELLPALRVLAAADGSELDRALEALTGGGAPPEAFDWSLVDWAAEDPFAAANAAAARADRPAGDACERRALQALCRLLQSRVGAVEPALARASAEPTPADACRQRCARVYLEGQRDLLIEALGEARSLLAGLDGGAEAEEESEESGLRPEKRVRSEECSDRQ